jgi:hypothetical protein
MSGDAMAQTIVPEPATLTLLACGPGVGAVRRPFPPFVFSRREIVEQRYPAVSSGQRRNFGDAFSGQAGRSSNGEVTTRARRCKS